MAAEKTGRIAFQGELGAYSHQACREAFPDMEVLPCATFEEAMARVRDGRAELAMMPVENSTYGRVADIHNLLPDSELHIIGEHFTRVDIHLLAAPNARIEDIREAHSHIVLLGQCREFLKKHGVKPVIAADTAGSAAQIAAAGDPTRAALASGLAGEINGLTSLAVNIQDHDHNTTRFLVMSRDRAEVAPDPGRIMTSFVFQVRNVPAALYKALGGFATNGLNMVKLESYMVGGSFTATQFYADIEGHPDERSVQLAMEELAFFTSFRKILGVYPMHPMRRERT